eukprot:scpid66091/ scgid14198/ Receptor-type tyrosine-protein phosphatase R; Phosphotyrosine phosphatase 13; Protein-tyrosine-phosphatase SL
MSCAAAVNMEDQGKGGEMKVDTSASKHCDLTLADLTDLMARVNTAIASEQANELEAQFEAIPLNMISPKDSPFPLETQYKNLYANVLPNVETLVRLEEDPVGDTISSYMNANYLQDYFGKKNAFIATQYPSRWTVGDFWRMVWQESVAVIGMATEVPRWYERYWPDADERKKVYGKLCVNVDDVTEHTDYVLTTMTICIHSHNDDTTTGTAADVSKEARIVRHFLFKGWPRVGIPLSTDPVLDFIDTIVDANVNSAPIIIHCSAGTGRTGTLAAIKMGMQQFEATGLVNPLAYLRVLRSCRGGSVQTFKQYLFVHRALLTHMRRNSSPPLDTASPPGALPQVDKG